MPEPRHHYLLFILVIAVLVIALFYKGCDSVVKESLTPHIDTLKIIETRYKDTVHIKEVIRNKVMVMWREVRHDSITPCETKLLICDTVIRVDSSLICSLKDVIRIDSTAILSQDSVIVGLRKSNRKLKRKNTFLTWLNALQAAINLGQAIRN